MKIHDTFVVFLGKIIALIPTRERLNDSLSPEAFTRHRAFSLPKLIIFLLSLVASGKSQGVDGKSGAFFKQARRSGLWPDAEAVHRSTVTKARQKLPWQCLKLCIGRPFSWPMRFGHNRQTLPGKIFNNSSDYNEFYFLLHFRDLVTTSISFSEDFYNEDQFAAAYEVSGRFPITDALQLSTRLGYNQVSHTVEYDYLYWDLGFTWFYKYGGLDFRYADGNRVGKEEELSQIVFDTLGPTFVFSISFGF